jgi:hypothetical protein
MTEALEELEALREHVRTVEAPDPTRQQRNLSTLFTLPTPLLHFFDRRRHAA